MTIRHFVSTVLLFLTLFLSACTEKKADLSSDLQKESYANGYLIASNIKPQLDYLKDIDVELDFKALLQGFEDVILDNEGMGQEDVQKYYSQLQSRLVTSLNGLKDKNISEGDAFLKENKAKPGVVTLASGLQYKVIKKGAGVKPKASDVVNVHYKGRFIDGSVFESSRQFGEPVTFPVQQVIPGWTEALQKMTVGSTWELYIPSKLAYGDQGNAAVEPGQLLIFEVELLGLGK